MASTPHEQAVAWLPLLPRHLDRVNEIADSIHTTLPERPEVFEEKCRLFPDGCRVLTRGENVVGYSVSHPWLLGQIPPLDEFLRTLPDNPTCLYLHDIVVLPEARGQNAAEGFVRILVDLAGERGIGHLALVSVYGTDALWSKHGFEVTNRPELNAKLRSYGPTAKYMTRIRS